MTKRSDRRSAWMGIALAMPLLAIGRIAVLRLYVEDCRGDKPS